jgi:hypothetical protein
MKKPRSGKKKTPKAAATTSAPVGDNTLQEAAGKEMEATQQLQQLAGTGGLGASSDEGEKLPATEWTCPATESMDLPSAIALALSQTSQLPLGNDNSHHSIGATCRVFWDDECRWFSARVLLYDPLKDRHFIFYDEVSERERGLRVISFLLLIIAFAFLSFVHACFLGWNHRVGGCLSRQPRRGAAGEAGGAAQGVPRSAALHQREGRALLASKDRPRQ